MGFNAQMLLVQPFKCLGAPACMSDDACVLLYSVLEGRSGKPDEALKIKPVCTVPTFDLPGFLPGFMGFPEVPMVEKVDAMTKSQVECLSRHWPTLGRPRGRLGIVPARMGSPSWNVRGFGKVQFWSVARAFVQGACQGVKQIT